MGRLVTGARQQYLVAGEGHCVGVGGGRAAAGLLRRASVDRDVLLLHNAQHRQSAGVLGNKRRGALAEECIEYIILLTTASEGVLT